MSNIVKLNWDDRYNGFTYSLDFSGEYYYYDLAEIAFTTSSALLLEDKWSVKNTNIPNIYAEPSKKVTAYADMLKIKEDLGELYCNFDDELVIMRIKVFPAIRVEDLSGDIPQVESLRQGCADRVVYTCWYKKCLIYNTIKPILEKLTKDCTENIDLVHTLLETSMIDYAVEYGTYESIKDAAKFFYNLKNKTKSPSIKKCNCDGYL